MKKVLLFKNIILILSLIMFSCSDTNDDIEGLTFENFLNKNDGTEWLLSNEFLTVYIRLNIAKEQLIEQWSYCNELDCYIYNPNIFIPGNFDIVENSRNKLVIVGDAVISDYEYMTFTRQGDTLEVRITLSEWEEETVYFTKSTIQVDDLKKCCDSGKKTDWLDYLLSR